MRYKDSLLFQQKVIVVRRFHNFAKHEKKKKKKKKKKIRMHDVCFIWKWLMFIVLEIRRVHSNLNMNEVSCFIHLI